MDEFWLFLGRWHPVFVHVPIGFFLLYGVLELCTWLARRPCWHALPTLSESQRTLMLALCGVTSASTALTGWLLSRGGSYDALLLSRHQLLGLSFVVCTLILLLMQLRQWRRMFLPLVAATVIILGVAGHFGGAMTHGEDYLTQHLPESLRRSGGKASSASAKPTGPLDPTTVTVFAGIIHPILERRCVSCHGPTKSNGDLRSDTWEQLARGGKSGPAITPGNSWDSLMIERLHLPMEEKQHMPPKGKPQLSEDEIALIHWWIDAGAPASKKLIEVETPVQIAAILQAQLGLESKDAPRAIDRAATLATAEKLSRQQGIIIRALTPDEPWLMVSARLKSSAFGDQQLAQLASIAGAIHWLDLGDTAVTDHGLDSLVAMTNLRRLHLDRTKLTDAGLANLTGLKQLHYLNLYGTQVSDVGLAALRPLTRLRSLFLWQTKVTPAGVKTLEASLIDKRKVKGLEKDLAEIKKKIAAEEFRVQFAENVATPGSASKRSAAPTLPLPPASKQSLPHNELCPVTGKPIDGTITLIVDGKVIAFCSFDCRERFQKDPEKQAALTP